MRLEERIELLHRSASRLMDSLPLTRDEAWWLFMRREIWVHLKRTVEAWWAIIWREK